MQVITKAILNIETGEWTVVDSYEYVGPVALCDRAASNEAKQAATNSENLATQEGSNANAEHAQLAPFYRQEMNAQHGFTPGQTNELLNYAGAGAGGAAATSAGQIASLGARTRNTAGMSAALDQNARDRMQTMGGLNLGVGAQDVMGAKQLNQEGAAGMAGLEGTDQKAQLAAMGLQNEDINTQLNANKSGWFQNLTGLMGAGGNLISALKGGQR